MLRIYNILSITLGNISIDPPNRSRTFFHTSARQSAKSRGTPRLGDEFTMRARGNEGTRRESRRVAASAESPNGPGSADLLPHSRAAELNLLALGLASDRSVTILRNCRLRIKLSRSRARRRKVSVGWERPEGRPYWPSPLPALSFVFGVRRSRLRALPLPAFVAFTYTHVLVILLELASAVSENVEQTHE